MTKKDLKFIQTIKHGGLHSFFKRAIELGVRVEPLTAQSKVVKLTYKDKVIYVRSGTLPVFKMMGQFTKNKTLTKAILKDAKISVPNGIVLQDQISFNNKIISNNNLKFPLIVKPQNGSRAKGVTWNIMSIKEAKIAVKKATRERKCPILIEEMFVGDEYRVFVFHNKVISSVLKISPIIRGNGHASIDKLIEDYNSTRKKEHALIIDHEVKENLRSLGYKLSSILKKNEELKLKNTFLVSDGARLVNADRKLGRFYKDICRNVVSVLNLHLGGVDIIVNEQKKPPYVVLEVNPNPFYNMHEKELVEGASYDISKLIVYSLFPSLKVENKKRI